MKPEHTYCFYMSNGEHIMTDADRLEENATYIHVIKEDDVFMAITKEYLMAWEQIR